MTFLQKIARSIREHGLLQLEERVLVAVSGGADSMALLLALKELGYEVSAAHCNFHLRGRESDNDEQFVQKLCRDKGIALHCTGFDTEAYAAERGISVEMAARELRYDWFNSLRDMLGIRCVAVAHHADDNAETFFLNLARGTGLRGLCGMHWQSNSVIRPMLEVSRQEIEAWLKERKQPYVTDSTNTDTRFKRNMIRHSVLPLFEKLNPSFGQTMVATLRLLNSQLRLQDKLVGDALGRLVTVLNDGIRIDAEKLLQEAAAQEILFVVLHNYGFNSMVVNDMVKHLGEMSGHIYENGDILATRTLKHIEIRRRPKPVPPTPLHEGENVLADGTVLRLTMKDDARVIKKKRYSCIDADRIRGPLYVRNIEIGDRFTPYGLYGSKLISDYLSDRKRPRIDRLGKKVVCDDEGILWLVGECTAQRGAVTDTTQRTLRIEML